MTRIKSAIRKFLMIPPNLVTMLWEKSDGQGHRSTVLRPLGWIFAFSATAAISSISVKAPLWLTVIFGAGAAISLGIYFFSYVYCLVTNPDFLRTERFTIQKMAIEKGFRGDSLTGIVYGEQPRLPASVPAAEEQS